RTAPNIIVQKFVGHQSNYPIPQHIKVHFLSHLIVPYPPIAGNLPQYFQIMLIFVPQFQKGRILKVSVVIVNYRVKYFLEQTLRSVSEALEGIPSEILVIDNNSGDDSIAYCRQLFTEVHFIENTENVGFARANNQGISVAKGDFILILNPDTIVCHRNIDDCLEWMQSHPDCGGIGVRMLNASGIFLPESKRSFPTPWVSFCKIFGLSALFPTSKRFARYHLRYLDEHEPHTIDILAGAFMFIRGDLLNQIGGFDQDFFMYGEDIDLSYRLIQAGFRNYYLPSTIIHYKGESTRKNSMRYVRVFYEAMLIFYRKHFPDYSRFFSFFIHLAVWIRAALAMLRRITINPVRKLLAGTPKPLQWLIVSTQPQVVAALLPEGSKWQPISADSAISARPVEVVIDNSEMDYPDIISYVDFHSGKGIHFHIYSHQSGIIVSP
ncbi:MAG: glycosyltransferase family 2 protein, partial [Muribaculaceae bacterium]|nr:glycosyltransferase family 2 protein [Muribaculaceae bacterium]